VSRISRAVLRFLDRTNASQAIGRSSWRQRRLLILCYHGIALHDEHEWSPSLYMDAELFAHRLQLIAEADCNVLPLGVAIRLLSEGALPPRAVTITFDDGMYDFLAGALPHLERYGYPATVYQTTFYSTFQRPLFEIGLSYVLWRARARPFPAWPEVGLTHPFSLTDEAERDHLLALLVQHARSNGLSAQEEDELLCRTAARLDESYDRLREKRILHLMTPEELVTARDAGIAFELHTHRHRTPLDEGLFRAEVRENREWLSDHLGVTGVHFCYPSGMYHERFLPWLADENVRSATTCVPGLASRGQNTLLLPRFVDTSSVSDEVFVAWLHGAGHLVRRVGGRPVVP